MIRPLGLVTCRHQLARALRHHGLQLVGIAAQQMLILGQARTHHLHGVVNHPRLGDLRLANAGQRRVDGAARLEKPRQPRQRSKQAHRQPYRGERQHGGEHQQTQCRLPRNGPAVAMCALLGEGHGDGPELAAGRLTRLRDVETGGELLRDNVDRRRGLPADMRDRRGGGGRQHAAFTVAHLHGDDIGQPQDLLGMLPGIGGR